MLHPIATAQQTQWLDRQTIVQESISSIDLMERASQAFCKAFQDLYPATKFDQVLIICGVGNNGGDGLAVARLLSQENYIVTAVVAQSNKRSPDNTKNLERLHAIEKIKLYELQIGAPLPNIAEHTVIIDAMFGSGLNRPLSGNWADWVKQINSFGTPVAAIDLPSGLCADKVSSDAIIKATHTISFQLPKLAFFAAENAPFVGRWGIVPIDLHAPSLASVVTKNYYIEQRQVASMLKSRGRFDHKGTFGHSLIAAGSYGKIGAAILCCKAALRTGCGLVTAHLPRCGYEIMQVAFPEAMVQVDQHRQICTKIPTTGTYDSIAIGPGWGTNRPTQKALFTLLKSTKEPLIIDADALNILAQNPDWLSLLPKESILTPHPKEFERLFGKTNNSFDTWELLRDKSQSLGVYILLKGGNTVIACPDRTLLFTNIGNPGMGTAGAGDVLTGILAGLLAQGYSPYETSLLGTFLHGIAGDLAAEAGQMESVIAEDIIQYLGPAFRKLREHQL